MKEYKVGDVVKDVKTWSRHQSYNNQFDLGIVSTVYGKDNIVELVNDMMNSSLDDEKVGAALKRILLQNICHMKILVGDKKCIVRVWGKQSLRILSWIR